MSFSTSVRDKALLASARHCCVCHRYGGALMDVYHITPQAQGTDPHAFDSLSVVSVSGPTRHVRRTEPNRVDREWP
jgi:hypothetical protein